MTATPDATGAPDAAASTAGSPGTPDAPTDFLREIVRRALAEGTYPRVRTRFPPEPNGFLHIGHAKAIYVDFTIAQDFDGLCQLRFDDTNPEAEEQAYVDAIIEDLTWFGFEPPQPVRYASDYFEQLHDWAVLLIEQGKAYVDDQDGETISAQRGDFGRPGIESPFRDRTPAQNLDLFARMCAGEFPDGSHVLRAKIDMNHENMQMRDPVMYRIRRAPHQRTGDTWCVYPAYDWAHGQSDAIEGVTHSLCTLEFDTHRPLYEWFLAQLPLPHETPKQIEFARLELTHTITSKRRLRELVERGVVHGWDDPRLPTLRGLRRRGYPAAALREFCGYIGVTRTNSRNDIELLESFVRRELNVTAQRRMAVLRPLKLVLTNWPVDDAGNPVVEYVEVVNNPENPADGTRQVPFTGELWIERDDYAQDPPSKYFRLSPGREVRLRGAYFVTATDAVLDESGEVVQVNATVDLATRGGNAPDGRKVKSTMHWVSARHSADATVALYERLFTAPVPGEATGEPMDDLNPDSRELLTGAKVEPALAEPKHAGPAAGPGHGDANGPGPVEVVQFERLGYFARDPHEPMLFHRTVGLRDEWARIQQRRQG